MIQLVPIETRLEEKLTWTVKRKNNIQKVTKNSDASLKNSKSKLKKITTPSKRCQKISEQVEKVQRDRRRTLL